MVLSRARHSPGWLLKTAGALLLAFFAAELAAGYYSRSLALISDAWHNFSSAAALGLTWFAYYLQGRAPSSSRTYGPHRAAVLAGFVAALVLMVIAGALIYRGYTRLIAPAAPQTLVMMLTGAAGAVLNVSVSAALRRSSWAGVPPHTALLHLAGDAIASFAILLAAAAIRLTGANYIDTILGLLIAGLIVWTAWDLVAESLNILLEGLPRGMSLQQVAESIRGVRGVEDVHDLHIWSLSAGTQALSCHVRIQNLPLAAGEAILAEVNAVLDRHFQIRHTTIQLECDECEVGCAIQETRNAERGTRN